MDPQKQPFSSSNESSDGAASSSFKTPNTPIGDDSSSMHDANEASTHFSDSADSGSNEASASESDASDPVVVIDSAKLHGDTEANQPSSDTDRPVETIVSPAQMTQIPEAPPASSMEASTVISPEAGLPPSPVPVGMMPDSNVTAAAPPPPPSSDSEYMTAMQPVIDTPRKSKKKLLIGLILVAIIVILLGATAAAYYVVMNKPQNVLDMALANTFSPSKVTSISFEGNASVTTGSTPITVTFSGASDQNGAFTLSSKIDALLTTITSDVRSADGSTLYARVGGLSGISQLLKASGNSFAGTYAPIIAGIDNQWIQINQSMVKQLTGSGASLSAKLNATDRQKLETAYKQNKFLVAQKSLAAESIKGRNSFHFQVIVDKTKLKSFVAAIKSANVQNLTITQDNLNTLNNQIDKADFGKYPVEIWVAKSNKLIDQIGFTTTQGDTKLAVRFTVDDYNKPVNVPVPSGAKTLLDVISNLLTGGSASALNSLSGVSL